MDRLGIHSTLVLIDHVAHAAHGVDQLRLERLVDLRAQLADIDIHDIRQPLEALIPHVLDDHRARKHAPGIGGQVLEQRVLLRGELDRRAVAPHLVREAVDLQVGNAA